MNRRDHMIAGNQPVVRAVVVGNERARAHHVADGANPPRCLIGDQDARKSVTLPSGRNCMTFFCGARMPKTRCVRRAALGRAGK